MWYIVTSSDDTDTLQLIENTHSPNIQALIYTGFFQEGCSFNKGGALRFAQDHIDTKHSYANVLILDADIYLPHNFRKVLPKNLEETTLYGVSKRIDYWTLEDFRANHNRHIYKYGNQFVGFFQLYKQCSLKYKDSRNCKQCDMDFLELFPRKKHLSIIVKHLGKDDVNHDGRTWYIE